MLRCVIFSKLTKLRHQLQCIKLLLWSSGKLGGFYDLTVL